MRREIRPLLTRQQDWILSEAHDGKTVVAKVRDENPDVVLLDIPMPSGDGLMAAYEIRQIAPETKILFLTECSPDQASALSRLFGCGEYVPKANMKTHLVKSISRLLYGSTEPAPESGVLPGAPPTIFH